MNQKKLIYSFLKFTSLAMLISNYSCSSRPLEIDSSEVSNFSNYELCGILEKGRYSESAKNMARREIEKRKYNCAEDFEEIMTDNPKGIKMGN